MKYRKFPNTSYIFITVSFLFLTAAVNAGQNKIVYRPGFNGRAGMHFYVSTTGSDDNSGSRNEAFRHIQYGIDQLNSGDTLTVLGGVYEISHEILIYIPDGEKKWTVIEGEENNPVILDAKNAYFPWNRDHMRLKGIFQIENSKRIMLRNFFLKNSHFCGISILESEYVNVVNCHVENTLASAIITWPDTRNIRILGNTVINANDTTLSWGPYYGKEAPHEAISIIGTKYFEVAYNLLRDCKKEGVDVKGASKHGTVHHNYFRGVLRQGLYVDSWMGILEDVELYENIVSHCGWGVTVSTEGGIITRDIRIHHNIFDHNKGPGIFISRWGNDNKKEKIHIYNNTLYRNCLGKAKKGWNYYWLVGGCYIYSTQVENLDISNNILSSDYPFELGYTYRYKPGDFKEKNIRLQYNLIDEQDNFPKYIYLAKWAKDSVRTTKGLFAVGGNPQFFDPENGDFRIKPNSPAVDAGDEDPFYNDPDGSRCDIGAIPLNPKNDIFWWKKNFPPKINLSQLVKQKTDYVK